VHVHFSSLGRSDRSVATVLCAFDGRTLAVKQVSNELRNPIGRGLLEPSLAFLDGAYYMTIRAEDDRGYVTTSADGLHWASPKPWAWDTGTPLTINHCRGDLLLARIRWTRPNLLAPATEHAQK
jgi:hypothetical protein